MKSPLSVIATILGILFVLLAVVYWMVPAQSLPGFLPGHEAGVATTHFKHGLASVVVGIVLLAFARFQGRASRA